MKILPTTLIALIIIGILPEVVSSQTIDLSKVDEKKSIDLRIDKSEDAWRMLVFMARDSDPSQDSKVGHAYVAAMQWRSDIQSFVTLSVFGAYPYSGDNSRGLLDYIDIDGSITLEPLDQYPDAALLVWVDEAQLADAIAVRDQWQRDGVWVGLLADCVSMFRDVASSVGVKLPVRLAKLPYPYIKEVMAEN